MRGRKRQPCISSFGSDGADQLQSCDHSYRRKSCKDVAKPATNRGVSASADHAILFKSWLEEHNGILVKVARSFAAASADVDDLQQEMKLQLWTSLGSFAGQAKPSTWIYRVCLNTALSWRRGTARRESRIQRDVDPGLLVSSVSQPDKANDAEIVEKLYAAIHALPMFDRALILLALDGLPYREIAEITGLTENHVGVSLTRARKRLATLMKGVTDELE
jgi:RNA polymerase sigma-70 factor (ECF subfamily)